MHNISYLFEPGAILLVLMLLTYVAMAIFRGKQIPQCFQCGAYKVRPSHPNGFLDMAGSIFMLKAYRCSGCRARFHAMRLFSKSGQSSL
jgi:hypothetical protein